MSRGGDFIELAGQDAYQILGLTPAATPDEIRTARRTRQMAVHPDRHGDAEQSKLVNYAAQILLDDETRRSYDDYRERLRPPRQRPPEPVAQESPAPGWTGEPVESAWPDQATQPMPTPYGPVPAPARSSGSTMLIALAVVVALAICVGCGPFARLADMLGL